MQLDGHRSWGFVIYRTTYAKDQDWARCLSRIHAAAQDCFEFYNGRDVLDLKKVLLWTILSSSLASTHMLYEITFDNGWLITSLKSKVHSPKLRLIYHPGIDLQSRLMPKHSNPLSTSLT